MKKRTEATQLLLIPMNVSLSHSDMETLLQYRAEIEAIGFVYTAVGYGLSVSEIPTGLTPAVANELLTVLADSLQKGTGTAALAREIIFEKALYQSACKASVKAGRVYDEAHLRWICDNLFRYDCIKYCPHGRPVAFEIGKKELDTHFGRT
jgi:DNA mismatch repair protein MutL